MSKESRKRNKVTTPELPNFKEAFADSAQKQFDAFVKSGECLVFPVTPCPVVSIVIVTYKRTALEFLCLLSILRWASGVCYEVILSNNGNTEDNKYLMEHLKNITVLSHEENLGFVEGVNKGAAVARGDYLLLLNDDALLSYQTLESLLEVLQGQQQVGVVGAQIRTLDNHIQDAGGILWNNGVAAEYSKGRNPDIGDVNYQREVDYVSGACLMTRTKLFKGMGGFDEVFSPGYCEESDYCCRLRKAGFKIIYQPKAHLIHYEYGSSDPEYVNRLVEVHTAMLVNKHKDLFATQSFHPTTPVAYARTTTRCCGRVLIVEDFVPHSYYRSEIATFINNLRRRGFFVTYYPRFSGVDDWQSVYELLDEDVEVMLFESIDELPRMLSERPRFYDYFISSSFSFDSLRSKHADPLIGKRVIEGRPLDNELLSYMTNKRLLWIDWHIPEPDTNAGDYAVYSYCNAFKDLGYNICYVPNDPAFRKQDSSYIERFRQEEWEIWDFPWSFEQTIADLGHTIDLVVVARPLAINYIDKIRAWSHAPIIYYCHDLHYLREQRRAQQNFGKIDIEQIEQLRLLEYSIIQKCDLTVTVSQFEKEELSRELPQAEVSVWPWFAPPKVTMRSYPTSPKYIDFIGGMQHTPNQDAIKWFVYDILPRIRKVLPDVQFNIIGSGVPEDIQKLHHKDNINVLGHVKEPSPFFLADTVLVAPMRFGAGLKGKIAMAMQHGLPVITTTIGAEGMGLTNFKNVRVVDDPQQFAEAVIEVMQEPMIWEELSRNSLEYARKHWSLESVQNQLGVDIKCIS